MKSKPTLLFLIPAALIVLLTAGCACFSGGRSTTVARQDDTVTVRDQGRDLVVYHLQPPPNSGLPLEAGDYFHPVYTPAGEAVTDFVPSDHKHHRGVFMAWVEMHGAKDADFWGWGEHAPIKDRKIVSHLVKTGAKGEFQSESDWIAEGTVMIHERLNAAARALDKQNVLDLTYEISPKAEVTLSRWAFSGFCLRVRKDGEVAYYSPQGLSSLKNPSHLDPSTDWPDAPWYAAVIKLPDGKKIGAAVFNHPGNPPTLWHNQRGARMINPCIVAPGEVKLKPGKPLTLRYRVVTFDGELPSQDLDRLAAEFRK